MRVRYPSRPFQGDRPRRVDVVQPAGHRLPRTVAQRRYEGMGFATGFSPVESNQATNSALFALGKTAGRWIRCDLPWDRVESVRGSYLWNTNPTNNLDGWVNAANGHGLRCVAVLGRCAAWALPGKAGTTSASTDRINFATPHGFVEGQEVKLRPSGTSSMPSGLQAGTTFTFSYYVNVVSTTAIRLRATPSATTFVNITSSTPVVVCPNAIGNSCPDPAFWADWEEYAYQTAKHFIAKGVLHYEIWNEVNIPSFATNMGVANYAHLLVRAHRAVKQAAVDSGLLPEDVVVLTSGLAPATTSGGTSFSPINWMTTLYSELNVNHGGARPFDGVALHPYAWFQMALPSDGDAPGGQNAWNNVPSIRAIIVANESPERAARVKIHATEVGVWSYENPNRTPVPLTEAKQAAWADAIVTKWFNDPVWSSYTGLLLWFTLRDSNTGGPGGDPDNAGVFYDANGGTLPSGSVAGNAPKPAFDRLVVLSTGLSAQTPLPPPPIAP